jgi:tRNA(Ile)-lysidine synthase
LDLYSRIRRTIRRYGLLQPGARVLVGVSGGSDSVALTHLLLDLSLHGQFQVVALAHLNHQIRAAAERDEQFCRDLASRLGLPFVAERADVPAYAASERLSLEAAGRRLRYDFLERAAAGERADTIAVGHTRDDQAETLLLKLVRGAGLTGLGGIHPRRGRIVRVLLDVSRSDLRGYLESRGVPWVEDETNQDLSNPRNRMRHVVLPELERTYGGPVTAALARAADLAREDGAWLDELSGERYRALAVERGDAIEIDGTRLSSEPGPIVRRVLLEALRRVANGREVTFEHVQSTLDVLSGACTGTDVPGGRVELRRGIVVLSSQGPARSDTLIG